MLLNTHTFDIPDCHLLDGWQHVSAYCDQLDSRALFIIRDIFIESKFSQKYLSFILWVNHIESLDRNFLRWHVFREHETWVHPDWLAQSPTTVVVLPRPRI